MDIHKIKELYENKQNLTEYFKLSQNKTELSSAEVELIYDLQSGNYSSRYEYDDAYKKYKDKYTDEIVYHINSLNFKFNSILEAGIGEGTTFCDVIKKLDKPKIKKFGLDISWSRLAYAKKFLKKNSLKNTKLVTGLLENLPFLENSIDIVYTSHSIEPNRGKEKEILKELYRVTNNYLILLEPSYEFGNKKQQERMDKLSYAKNLSKYCEELNYKIIKHELIKSHSRENNRTSIIIIEKSTKENANKGFLACPQTKIKLLKNKNFYYALESFYSYPILKNIACLNIENKILSTKLQNFIPLHKEHPKYNEERFIKSLKETLKKKISKDTYYFNTIGFLAIQENLEDAEFVENINQIIKDFSNAKFKAFIFNRDLENKIKEKFPLATLELIELKNTFTIYKNTQVYLSNIFRSQIDTQILMYLRNYSIDTMGIGLYLDRQTITLRQHEIDNPSYYYKFFRNLEFLGFKNKDIEKYGNSFHELYFKKASSKYNVDINFSLDESISKAYLYWNLKIGLADSKYFKDALIFAKNFVRLKND